MKKYSPQTECKKVPRELCGPSGCIPKPGPEKCHDKKETVVQEVIQVTIFIRDPPNVPCSAEGSGEGSVIFSEFSVPLFKGGTGKVCGTFIFHIFKLFYIYQAKKIYINLRKFN